MKRDVPFLVLTAALSLSSLSHAAGPGPTPPQTAACRDAVRAQTEMRGVDAGDITITDSRPDQKGRLVLEWKAKTPLLKAEGICRFDSPDSVGGVKIKELTRTPPPRPKLQPPPGITMEPDVIRRGRLYQDFRSSNPEECAKACMRDQSCVAYNYRIDNGNCSLKDGFKEVERENGVVSGEKGGRPPRM